jgi:hypothetical protein
MHKIFLPVFTIFLVPNVFAQHVGIGTTTPHAQLQLGSSTANRKIVLFEHVNDDHQFYGFGVNGGVLRYQTATSNDDHVFYAGNGNNTSRELIRIKGNGNVGIGTNAPAFRLDVDNRMRIRSGGDNNNSAGIWLNSNNNAVFQAFVGINETSVGFFGGIGGDWGLQMNTQNGNVGIGGTNTSTAKLMSQSAGGVQLLLQNNLTNDYTRIQMRNGNSPATTRFWDIAGYIDGATRNNDRLNFYNFGIGDVLSLSGSGAVGFMGNFGQPGQILVSNGTNAAPTWQAAAGGGNNNLFVARASANSADLVTGSVDVPGLVANFNLTAPAKVEFNFRVRINNRGCFACNDRRTFVELVQLISGGVTVVGSIPVYTPNSEMADGVSGPFVVELPAGNYSYKVRISTSIFGTATTYAQNTISILTWRIYPN